MLDSAASNSVLNYSTYLTIAKLLNITCNNKTNHTSKTLTVANQTEVPNVRCITTTLNTSIEQISRQFIIPFVVADINLKILGTFVEVFTDDKHENCSTIIQNSTNHLANLLNGHNGNIEVPITNEQPKCYQVNDLNTLVHNVAHTYYPDLTEPIPLSNYNTPTQDTPSSSNHFSIYHIYKTSLT